MKNTEETKEEQPEVTKDWLESLGFRIYINHFRLFTHIVNVGKNVYTVSSPDLKDKPTELACTTIPVEVSDPKILMTFGRAKLLNACNTLPSKLKLYNYGGRTEVSISLYNRDAPKNSPTITVWCNCSIKDQYCKKKGAETAIRKNSQAIVEFINKLMADRSE